MMSTPRMQQNYTRQRFTPGGVTTEAQAPPQMQMEDQYNALFRQRPVQRPDAGPRASAGYEVIKNEAPIPGPNVNEEAERMEARVRVAQAQALLSPPPMRMVSGPGITPGYMPDVNAMSGIQRKIFLPQGSTQTAAGAEDDTLRQNRNASSFQNFQNESAQRQQIEASGGGGMSGGERADAESGFTSYMQAQALAEADRRRRMSGAR